MNPEQPSTPSVSMTPMSPMPPRSTARSSKSMTPKTRKKIILYSCLGILVAICLVAAYYIHAFYSFADTVYDNSKPAATMDTAPIGGGGGGGGESLPIPEPPDWDGEERVNILLLGGDSRGVKSTVHPRSDTMMIVSIDPVDKTIHLFSLLRDSYVPIPNYSSNRINTAITLGGPRLAMTTVSDLVDLPIHYYVYTDFEGFISLIDALGGIDFDVDKAMHRVDTADDPRYNIHLEAGMQHLDGLSALQYMRFRSDGRSDFGRSDRQRKLLSAIADEMKKVTSLIRLPQVLNSIAPYIETDISPGDLFDLARLGLKLDTSSIVSLQLPQSGAFQEANIRGMDVLVVDEAKIRSYVKEQLAL